MPHEALVRLLAARSGHFRLESGHHSDLWLDLELLCLRPARVHPFAAELARRLLSYRVDIVCGPLVEGAFVGLLAASALDVEFCYTERFAAAPAEALYGMAYRLPDALRAKVGGRRVAIVNDVINAGSAVRGTFLDLRANGAQVVAIGALLVLGSWAAQFAADEKIALECLTSLPNSLWLPSECPLCASHIPLQDLVH